MSSVTTKIHSIKIMEKTKVEDWERSDVCEDISIH